MGYKGLIPVQIIEIPIERKRNPAGLKNILYNTNLMVIKFCTLINYQKALKQKLCEISCLCCALFFTGLYGINYIIGIEKTF